MSDTKLDSPRSESTEQRDSAGHETPLAAAAPSTPPAIKVDDSQVEASYANFCRVTGTPEELIIDFGLNPQPVGVPVDPIKVSQRLVTNFYTAKRLCHALQLALSRHEAAFGVLETNVQKRVQGSRS